MSYRGLILHAPFIQNALDRTEYRNQVTLQGTSYFAGRELGGYTNGVDSPISYAHRPEMLLGDMTCALWFRLITWTAAYSRIVDKDYTTGFIICRDSSTDKIVCAVTGSPAVLSSTTLVQAGKWIHITLTRSGSTLLLYINGLLEAQYAGNATVMSSTSSLFLGTQADLTIDTAGYYKDVRLYNRCLTPHSVMMIYTKCVEGKTNV